jgi:hypothetical protein
VASVAVAAGAHAVRTIVVTNKRLKTKSNLFFISYSPIVD